MRENRIIALAGLFQALTLVRAVALRGTCDDQTARHSLASVFRIDADSPADVYGGVGNLRLGLETLIAQLDGGSGRDLDVTRMAIQVLRLQRTLMRRSATLNQIRKAIGDTAIRAEQVESGDVDPRARLSAIYRQTLSLLHPRVRVEGNPFYLQHDAQTVQIRALLFAAMRAVVLWRQLGGSHWSLILRRRQYAMLARGLLAGCAIEGK